MDAPLELGDNRRLELGILLVTSIFAIQIVVRGSVTIFDAIVLLALYVLYARRVQGTPDEEPAVVGVAAGLLSLPPRYQRPAITALIVGAGVVVLTIANPFADALLATGTSLGIDPYLLIQSVVPAATEAPEFVIVAVLVVNHRPAQGLALFLASSVSQWTLGLGALPIAYLAGGGGVSMPLAAREQLELGFTIAVTLFVVAALATLRPEPVDAYPHRRRSSWCSSSTPRRSSGSRPVSCFSSSRSTFSAHATDTSARCSERHSAGGTHGATACRAQRATDALGHGWASPGAGSLAAEG